MAVWHFLLPGGIKKELPVPAKGGLNQFVGIDERALFLDEFHRLHSQDLKKKNDKGILTKTVRLFPGKIEPDGVKYCNSPSTNYKNRFMV